MSFCRKKDPDIGRSSCKSLSKPARMINRSYNFENSVVSSRQVPVTIGGHLKGNSQRKTNTTKAKKKLHDECLDRQHKTRGARRAFGFQIHWRQKDKTLSTAAKQTVVGDRGSDNQPVNKADMPTCPETDVTTRDILPTDYADNIIRYTKTLEQRFKLPSDFMKRGTVNGQSRAVVVNWLIQVQSHLNLEQQILHLAVGLLDHYLVLRCNLPQDKLQLVAVSCMFIASKYEDRYTARIKEFLIFTDKSYKRDQVIRMEETILRAVNFEVFIPTSLPFLDRVLTTTGVSIKVAHLSRYILDLTLCCPDASRISPSVKAGASVYLANKIINHKRIVTWIISLSYTLGCRMRDIKACAVMFAKHLLGVEKNKLQAARRKYALDEYLGISICEDLCSKKIFECFKQLSV